MNRYWSVVMELIMRMICPGAFSLTAAAWPPTTRPFSGGISAPCIWLRTCGPGELEISVSLYLLIKDSWELENKGINSLTPWVGYCGGACSTLSLGCLAAGWNSRATTKSRGSYCSLEPAGQNSFSASKPLPTSFWPHGSLSVPETDSVCPFLRPLLVLIPLTVLSSALYPPAHQLMRTHFSDGLPQCLRVENPPVIQEPQKMRFRSLGQEDPLEEGMTTRSSILAWRIPMDKGAWRATVHGVKSQTHLSD